MAEEAVKGTSKYGILYNESDLKLQRIYFNEMVKLQGFKCIYYAPRHDKDYSTESEIFANYQEPEVVGTIFHNHIDQRTCRKLGWNAEIASEAVVMSVPYDLHDLQVGALFEIPSGLDDAQGRLFKVTQMSTIMMVPASISIALIPEIMDDLPSESIAPENGDMVMLSKDPDDMTL